MSTPSWRIAHGRRRHDAPFGREPRLIVKWLIDRGKDVNARAHCVPHQSATFLDRSPKGWTPLDFAATGRGSDEWLFNNDRFQPATKLLLEYGAELSPLSAICPCWSHKPSVTPDYALEECSRIRKKLKLDLVVSLPAHFGGAIRMQLMGATGNVGGDYEKIPACFVREASSRSSHASDRTSGARGEL